MDTRGRAKIDLGWSDEKIQRTLDKDIQQQLLIFDAMTSKLQRPSMVIQLQQKEAAPVASTSASIVSLTNSVPATNSTVSATGSRGPAASSKVPTTSSMVPTTSSMVPTTATLIEEKDAGQIVETIQVLRGTLRTLEDRMGRKRACLTDPSLNKSDQHLLETSLTRNLLTLEALHVQLRTAESMAESVLQCKRNVLSLLSEDTDLVQEDLLPLTRSISQLDEAIKHSSLPV
jgi:hypothetical protein